MSALKQYSSILPLIDNYSYFIIDLWGVIHDGQKIYPGVIEALTMLRKEGKNVIFLSNAPRRAEKAVAVLGKLGVDPDLYDDVITSGEVTFNYVRTAKNLGRKYSYIGPEKDADILEGLDFVMTDDAAEANFALVTGFDHDESTLDEKIDQVEACIQHNLLLICANPDREVVRQSGVRLLCAGIIAEEYQKRGGRVLMFGKPYEQVYRRCMERFEHPPLEQVVAIGDGLHTDIEGANRAGITSILCTGGILASRLNIKSGEMPETSTLEAVFEEENIFPSASIPAFSLGLLLDSA